MPHTWHNKIGRSASRAISFGENDDFLEFASEMDAFNRYWADDIDYEGDQPIYVFHVPGGLSRSVAVLTHACVIAATAI